MHRYSYEDGARLLVSPLALPELSLAQAMRIIPRRGADDKMPACRMGIYRDVGEWCE